jgi:hypothetical protein
MDPYPLKHETADPFTAWFGANSTNMYDLGAEIQSSSGDEQEKHTFTNPTVVSPGNSSLSAEF